MRKILLGTTAVVGAALLAPAAFAQAPVTVAPQGLGTGTQMGTQAITPMSPAIAGAGGLQIRLGGYFDFSAATSTSASAVLFRPSAARRAWFSSVQN